MLLRFSPSPSNLEEMVETHSKAAAAAPLRHRAIHSHHVATVWDSRPISTTRSPTPSFSFSSGGAAVRAATVGDNKYPPPNTGGEEEAVFSSEHKTADEVKAALYRALEGNRGIFGIQSSKKAEIEGLVEMLEFQNPTPEPTDHLHKVGGRWKLIYSTITILGSKRTKLGLRDFITLGDFSQTIDVSKGKATNEIKFNARGIKMLEGHLTVEASFKIASKKRVDIKYEDSGISPVQLKNLFQKNYDLLMSIFNPDGWLEITYVDDSIRIGRDDKGNIFILERNEGERDFNMD